MSGTLKNGYSVVATNGATENNLKEVEQMQIDNEETVELKKSMGLKKDEDETD